MNKTVAGLLNKLLIEFTKSRARRTNDNALVEGKNGAVVRKPDARWGEVPVAFVALRPGGDADAAALAVWCRERLAHYKLPREFRFVDAAALPRSSTGKIQRHEIERSML